MYFNNTEYDVKWLIHGVFVYLDVFIPSYLRRTKTSTEVLSVVYRQVENGM